MYTRDPAVLANPARRIVLYRRIFYTSPFLLLLLFGMLALLFRAFPAARMSPLLGIPALIVVGTVMFSWFCCAFAFQSGLVICPCCDCSFTLRQVFFPRLIIPIECETCGFNVVTLHRRGDF
jgi:hypothetical protein